MPEILDGKAPANTPAVRSLFEPGLRFQYSGGGTIISQLMITDVTGQRYETFMRDSVLKPLGMVHSYFSAAPPAGDQLKKIARGYTKEGAEVKATFHVYPEQAPLGLWTTPSDLCRYMIELQKAYQGSSSKVLNREMAGLHLTPYIDKSVAMGVFTDERKGVKYFFHDAANEGYRGLYYGTVEGGDGVAICVNSDDGTIILELLNSVASVYNWGGFDKPLSIDPVKLPEAIAQKYPGIYIYDGDIAEITKEADGLYFWTAGQNCKMYFTSEKDFVNVEFTAEKSFITNASGTVTGYARKVKETVYPPAIKVNNLDTVKVNEGQMSLFGWHLLESKRYNKAMSCFTRVLELKPDDVTAKRNLGHCYLFTGEYDKAIKLYKECLVQLPGGPSPKEALNMEFGFFEKSGFDKTVMQKAGKELGL